MSPAGEHRVIRAKATGRTMLRDPDAIRDRAVAMYRGRLAG